MKRFLQFCLFLFFSLSAFALEEGHARYVGGTVPGLTSGVIGRLDTTSTTSLTFARTGNKVEIPYASIESYEYSKDVTRHLGVLPAIAVGLVKMRRHSHYFSISYRTEAGWPAQIVVLEVPKDMPRSLQAILQTRAPQAGCNRKNAPAPLRSRAATDDHPPLPIEAP
jgi:hypothetical protein